MKVLMPGHHYQLDNMDPKESQNQEIKFVKKVKNELSGKFETLTDGTTNEEVIAILIDRITYLNSIIPCRENSLAITKLEEAKHWLMARTFDRVKRDVEGTDKK